MYKRQVVPFVRAPWNDFVTIKRILDAGVSGILVPYVNSAEEAARAVSACKYPLEGIRGIAPSPRAGGYGMNQRDYLDYANEELDVLVAVETKTAVDHIEEIVKTNGLDGIFIGPMDLATSFGHFCNPKDEEVQEAIRKVESVVLGSDKFLATVAGSFEEAKKLYEKGYSMVIMMSDTTLSLIHIYLWGYAPRSGEDRDPGGNIGVSRAFKPTGHECDARSCENDRVYPSGLRL